MINIGWKRQPAWDECYIAN